MFHARCKMFQEGYGQWYVCWSIFTSFHQLMSGMSGALNKTADAHLWRIGQLLIQVPMFLKISWICLGHLQRSFLERMLSTKGAFERKQNLHSWCICWICYIRWAPFKKANLRALPLIFGSEILPDDLIPVFWHFICDPKESSRTSWIVGSTLQIPSFSYIFFFNNSTSDVEHQRIWWKKCHENVCEKISDKFCINHFLNKCVPTEPTTKTSGTFFLWCTLQSGHLLDTDNFHLDAYKIF